MDIEVLNESREARHRIMIIILRARKKNRALELIASKIYILRCVFIFKIVKINDDFS